MAKWISKIARTHRGTGLGLPISLGLAQLHGGTLRITSVRDQGSEVTFLLPTERVLTSGAFAQKRVGSAAAEFGRALLQERRHALAISAVVPIRR